MNLIFQDKKILLIFFLLYLLILIVNFNFDIISKGNLELNFLSKIFNFLFLFGFSSYIVFLIDYKKKIKKKFNIFLLLFISAIEGFFSYISILSRAYIFNQIAITYSYLIFVYKNNKINNVRFFLYIITVLLLFFISVLSVNSLRSLKNNDIYHDKKISNIEKIFTTSKKSVEDVIFYRQDNKLKSLYDRWTGIDGLVNVINKKNSNFEIFKKVLLEKNVNKKSVYVQNFVEDSGGKNKYFFFDKNQSVNTILVPGIIGFSYISGNLAILTLILLLITSMMFIIEKIILYLTCDAKFLTSLLSMNIVWRIIHFGVVPFNTIFFLLSILSIPIMLFLLSRLK